MDRDEFIDSVQGLIEGVFQENKAFPQTIFALFPGDGPDVPIIAINVAPLFSCEEDKMAVFKAVGEMRAKTRFVCLATEVWYVSVENGPAISVDENMVPSEHPDREEALLLTVYSGLETKVFVSPILRSGELVELKGWKPVEGVTGRGIAQSPATWN